MKKDVCPFFKLNPQPEGFEFSYTLSDHRTFGLCLIVNVSVILGIVLQNVTFATDGLEPPTLEFVVGLPTAIC